MDSKREDIGSDASALGAAAPIADAGARPRPGAGPGPTGRRPAAVATHTREVILDAALRAFAARGFAATSLRDVAAASGTTHGLIRHHFGAKDAVWRAAVDRAVARFADAVAPYALPASVRAVGGPAAPGVPDSVMAHAARGLGDFLGVAARHPDVVRLLVHEGDAGGPRLDYLLGRFRPIGERMAPLFARLQAEGALRAFPDNQTFFLTFLTAGAVPFALPALAAALGAELGDEAAAREHAARVVGTLLGTPPAAPRPARPPDLG
jgi:AcrR family transcriptional regulator